MLTFAYSWLFALLPLPLLVWWLLPPRQFREVAVRVPFLSRVDAAGGSRGIAAESNRARRLTVPVLLWLSVIVALARPQWLEPPITRQTPTRDLLLLVDLSGSMEQKDFTNTQGRTVDRLSAVKEVLGDFLTKREGDRVGLVVFGDAPFLQAPFTTDLALCRQLLDETAVRMAGPRTALGDAIGLGITLFEKSDAPAKTIIALTDGNDTASAVPPVEAAKVARDRKITIHTVAVGDPTTVGEEKIDEPTLRGVAESTSGSFFAARDRVELAKIYARLDQIETRKIETVSHRPRRDLFHWPLAAGLLLSLAHCALSLLSSPKAEPARGAGPACVRVDPRTGKLEVAA
jgi:Ca-activated chloride channel family protein